MNEINILDKQTIDKIAAGEVVDRPSSIVKELCENAIDAGATAISVEIEMGGIRLIRITDNGCGVAASEVSKAFKRHATSKIKDSDDLNFIKTLGFRGEALSSIAAVSRLEFCTKTKDELTGTIYKVNGGEDIGGIEAGLPEGTTVIVKDLFYNTPARLKFLKSPATEAAHIAEIIEKTALAHPEISFKLKSNGTVKLTTTGNGELKDAIYSIYGKDIAERLIRIDEDGAFLSVRGYIARPVIARGNRAFENYFINGRYVKDKVIEAAIEEAYRGYQMKGTFPFTAFDIIIEPELIDVNVHPSKMEIRFFDNEKVYNSILEIIKGAILDADKIPDVRLSEERSVVEHRDIPEPFEAVRSFSETDAKEEQSEAYYQEDFDPEITSADHMNETFEYDSASGQAAPQRQVLEEEIFITDAADMESEQASFFDGGFLSKKARINHRLVGEVFDTYWIVEYDSSIYIIDQHAAHEKVIFERLMSRIRNGENHSQKIMPALIIELRPTQEEALGKYLEQFRKLGFEIQPFGEHDYKIDSVPMSLYGLDSKEQFLLILDELSELKGGMSFEILLDKVASAACKAAVKGGNRLSFAEADHLIDELLSLENPYNCPHGRPTIISMTRSELEKKFKRIV